MGQPGMPMLTRLGVTNNWRCFDSAVAPTQPFFQEAAIKDYIKTQLNVEGELHYILRDLFYFFVGGNHASSTVVGVQYSVLLDTLATFYDATDDLELLAQLTQQNAKNIDSLEALPGEIMTPVCLRVHEWLIIYTRMLDERFIETDTIDEVDSVQLDAVYAWGALVLERTHIKRAFGWKEFTGAL